MEEPPQFYIRSFSDGGASSTERCISSFPHPYPTLRGLQKDIVRYQRADGVDLNATLYLPPGKCAVLPRPLHLHLSCQVGPRRLLSSTREQRS